jgi:hypothetical protein
MTFCLPVAYYREYLEKKERREKGLEEPLLVRFLALAPPWKSAQSRSGSRMQLAIGTCSPPALSRQPQMRETQMSASPNPMHPLTKHATLHATLPLPSGGRQCRRRARQPARDDAAVDPVLFRPHRHHPDEHRAAVGDGERVPGGLVFFGGEGVIIMWRARGAGLGAGWPAAVMWLAG